MKDKTKPTPSAKRKPGRILRDPRRHAGHKRLITLWILRAFSPERSRKHLFRETDGEDYADQDIADFLKLPLIDCVLSPGDPGYREELLAKKQQVFGQMESMLVKLEARPSGNCFTPAIRKNLDTLSTFLGLNSAERAVLEFVIASTVSTVLHDMLRVLERANWQNLSGFLSLCLMLPPGRIHRAIRLGSRLFTCGILERGGEQNIRGDYLPRLFSKTFAAEIFSGPIDAEKILSHIVTPSQPSTLSLSDFPHLDPVLSLLIPYLKKSVRGKKMGVNIFIHGCPGTGKSELTRLLSTLISAKAYEVPTEDAEGNPSEQRLKCLRVANTFLQPGNNLLIFDEAEDIFSSHSAFSPSSAQTNKGWINRLLETNRVPIIWVSNDVDCLDNAFTRRFDFVFEVPVPPRGQRNRTIRNILGETCSETFVHRLSRSAHISPAIVARAEKVASCLIPGDDTPRRESAVSLLVTNTVKAQGHPDPLRHSIDPIYPATYDIAHLNCSAELGTIARALSVEKSARICLYGPPGTGKTAFGHWLAGELSLPLHCTKASDLLTPFLGGTEKNMARAFDAALQEQAILLIDEVDSFLRDRTLANRSWEISQVNEFLTQLENFPGIFIASTNLRENLDPASLRRFDLKLHFDYLLPEQSLRLLQSHCKALQLTEPTPEDIRSLQHLQNATPGDFANVARQCRFQKPKSASQFLRLLIVECEIMAATTSRKIGFLQ